MASIEIFASVGSKKVNNSYSCCAKYSSLGRVHSSIGRVVKSNNLGGKWMEAKKLNNSQMRCEEWIAQEG